MCKRAASRELLVLPKKGGLGAWSKAHLSWIIVRGEPRPDIEEP